MEEDCKSIEEQLAEAEERGYKRGLNEQIARKMEEPGVWEDGNGSVTREKKEGEFEILSTARRSVWD